MMRISKVGLNLIKKFEGFSSIIYLDSVGLPTIGYGHLILPTEKNLFKNGVSDKKAEELLEKDVYLAETAVNRLIRIQLSQNQFDALVSFTFNLGNASLQRSTLRAKINREEHESIPTEMLKWVWAGGRKSPGLIRRRIAEGKLYS